MGKAFSIVGGIVTLILGLWGLIGWWSDFVSVLKGTVPAILILGGAIALIAGASEAKDALKAKK